MVCEVGVGYAITIFPEVRTVGEVISPTDVDVRSVNWKNNMEMKTNNKHTKSNNNTTNN